MEDGKKKQQKAFVCQRCRRAFHYFSNFKKHVDTHYAVNQNEISTCSEQLKVACNLGMSQAKQSHHPTAPLRQTAGPQILSQVIPQTVALSTVFSQQSKSPL